MKKLIYCILGIVLILYAMKAQAQDTSRFRKEWQTVDSLLQTSSQPKTALQKVNEIYAEAARKNIPDQKIKALLYRLHIEQTVQDNDINTQIVSVEKNIAETKNSVEISLLQVLEAQLIISYYNDNRWNILNRKKTVNYVKQDIAIWSADDFTKKIHELFTTALSNEALKTTPVKDYNAIVIKGDTNNLRPTLWDLAAHFALDYYKSNPTADNVKPAYAFQLMQRQSLAPAQEFVQYSFETKDTLSPQYLSLQLFQRILSFHLHDKNPAALVDADEERIYWCYSNLIADDKDSLYLNALKNIEEAYPNLPETKQAAYLRAFYYYTKASSYHPYGDTTHQYDYVKAMEIINQNIHTTDSSAGLFHLLQLKNYIEQKSLDIQIENVNSPNLPMRALFAYKNISKVFLRVIKVKYNYGGESYSGEYWKKIVENKNIVAQAEQQLPVNTDYRHHSAELKIDALPAGYYILLASDSENFSLKSKLASNNFTVSALSYISNTDDYFILDRESGQPIANAAIHFIQKGSIVKTLYSDDNGYFKRLEKDKYYDVNEGYIVKGNDTLSFSHNDGYYDYSRNNDDDEYDSDADYEKGNARIYFYTDRNMYRPGQTIFYKGIALTKDRHTHNDKLWHAKDTLLVYLKDANNHDIDSAIHILNDYSSFAGSFTIPQNVLTGSFSITEKTIDGSADFRVEEYKRPTFYVDFDKIKSEYKLGDSIVITGFAKAYAGNNVDGAMVKVNVSRNTNYPYPWRYRNFDFYPSSDPTEILNDTVTTDENGKFTIRFKALPDSSVDKKTEPVFNYRISAEVTDNNGETRTANTNISAAYKNLLISIQTPKTIDVDSLKNISVTTTNLSYQFIPADVTVKIYPLQSPERLIRQRFWARPDQFVMDKKTYLQNFPFDEYDNETNITSWKKEAEIYHRTQNDSMTNAFSLDKLNAGWYYITAVAKDKEGNEVEDVKYIQVVDNNYRKDEFLYSIHKTPYIEAGKIDSIVIGTGAKDVYVIQSFAKNDYKGNSTTVYTHFNLSEGQQLIAYKTSESDRYGVAYGFAFVRHNRRYYNNAIQIHIQPADNSLNITYAIFRDKTEPGAKEKFIVQVKNKDSSNADAELLSAMYDASLDALYDRQSWDMPAFEYYHAIYNTWSSQQFVRSNSGIQNDLQEQNHFDDKNYSYFIFNYDNSYFYNESQLIGDASPEAMAAVPAPRVNRRILNEAPLLGYGRVMRSVSGSISAMYSSESSSKLKSEEIEKGEQAFSPRTNFNETAFFYPQLYADKNGNYTIEFTMPDAVTTWHWMNLAYDKNLNFGYSDKDIISQKTLMVQPDMPRFLRAGDSIYLSAKISNLSNKTLSGNATIELINPINNETIRSWNTNSSAAFSVLANQSASVIFPLAIPKNYTNPVSIIIKANAGNFSDGEEHTLPVLSNRLLITESLPLFMDGDGTKNFSFDKLKTNSSNTLQSNSLTVEYTSNPVWYAVQSLPYLMQYPYECAEQTFSKFYANALGMYITAHNPIIKNTFSKWQKDTTALQSNLEKNQELKQLLLNETPWVTDAENEATQKRNVALLFDSARVNGQLTSLLNTLKQLQKSSGGFAWFKGGSENRYITQYIVTGIGKLLQLNFLSKNYSSQLSRIASDAREYLKSAMDKDYSDLLKYKIDLNKNNVSPIQMQYLYAKTFFDKENNMNKAEKYFYEQEKKYWNTQSNYFKSMIAITVYRNGDKAFAINNVVKSVIENAVEDSAKGMYWKDNQAGYYWYQAPIEQQSLMIDALNEIAQKENNVALKNKVAEMQQWLIVNKQVNSWETTKATADACFALLNANKNLDVSQRNVTIQLGNDTIQPNKIEAGTGYFKNIIKSDEVKNNMGNITINISSPDKNVQSPSYGSVYWQYFEDMDKVTTAATNLSIHKKLFIEKNTDEGKKLFALNAENTVNIGDKLIVRIEIKTDRDMEFVHLKDMRASSMEPDNVLSTYKWQDGLGYYEATKDASTDFFFDRLPKGTYVFDYPVHITHSGNFSSGIATIECMYAPEFSSHSEGFSIHVKEK